MEDRYRWIDRRDDGISNSNSYFHGAGSGSTSDWWFEIETQNSQLKTLLESWDSRFDSQRTANYMTVDIQ